ncbi:MAG: kelch-like protein [Bacteroidetes bacterium]|nr:MAG: kelch-like protein [Bacteroidota bacterium]
MKNKYLFLLVIIIISNVNILSSEVKWRIFGNLNQPRTFINAVAISDTEIIVIGGYNSFTNDKNLSSCEIIDVKNDTIKNGPSMNFPRSYYATIVTKDTNIIVVSGCRVGIDQLTPSVEMFDRKTRRWRYLGNLKVARWQHNAELINDNEIIVIGGRLGDQSVINSVEIFNLNNGISRIISPYPFPTSDGVSGFTSEGKLVAFGGRAGGPGSYREKNIYIFDTVFKDWTQSGMLNTSINKPSLLKLSDLRLFCAGGSTAELPDAFSDEIYIENNGLFSFRGNMIYNRIRFGITQYNSDSVIIVGGYLGNRNYTGKCEWYNIKTYEISSAPDLNFARFNHATITLPDPNNKLSNVVLVIGGNINNDVSLNSVEILRDTIIYKPPPPPLISESSADCDNFYFTVADSNLIDRVELTGFDNQNVRISTIESLPASVVHVVVSLIDHKKNGYFEVTCFSNKTGLSASIKDTILSRMYYLNVISPVKNGNIDLGDTVVNNMKCVDVLIENNGFQDVMIDSANLVTNSEFFVPTGQLPLNIPYGQQRIIRICFQAGKPGNYADTLYLRDNCDSLSFPVIGRGFVENAPLISDSSRDCYNYYFTVVDSNFIDSVKLEGPSNKNVRLSVAETLPSQIAHITISLIDKRLAGIFNISCISNNTGLSKTISGMIEGDMSGIYAHFPFPDTYIFIFDTIVNASKCENLIIENKGTETISIDSAFFHFDKKFSIPAIQLPIVIPPGEEAQLMICFMSDTSGFYSDTLYLTDFCDTLAYTVVGKAYGNIPTQVADSSFDCENYYITVVDSNYINRIELSGNENINVKINIQENLPARVVHITISLINPDRDGYFTITFYCIASNKSVDRKGTIYSHPEYLLVLDPLDSGAINLDNTEFGELNCVKVLLQNTAPKELVLDYVQLSRNIEFSIPQYQLPIIIPTGERRVLKLCYQPSILGEQWDTLSLNDICDTLVIPVKAVGDTVHYTAKSRCNIPILGNTRELWNNVYIRNPYPNPGNTVATVEVISDNSNESNLSISGTFLSNIGNSISIPINITETNIVMGGEIYKSSKFEFNMDGLASGAYFIQIMAGENKKILPYFILR